MGTEGQSGDPSPDGSSVTGSEAVTGETPPGEFLSWDDVFHLLQNQRRRRVLRYLRQHDDGDGCDMRDVVEWVAAREHDTTVEALHSKERQRVYIALYQTHFPKLADHGIIEYNQPRGWLSLADQVDQLMPYLPDAPSPFGGSHGTVTDDARAGGPHDDASVDRGNASTDAPASPPPGSPDGRPISSLFDLAALVGTGIVLALSAAGAVPVLPAASAVFATFALAILLHHVT